jgi:ABC-type transport system involved in cytochrome bd biosynthesis fused ATPase/permease subunit
VTIAQQKGYHPARHTIKEPMKSLRQFVFFFLLSCTGLLWAAFLLFNSSWFLPGIAMIGIIPATNVIVLILWLRS